MQQHLDHTVIRVRHFAFPSEVLDDPSLTTEEQRALLSEWASDACAIPSFPNLRLLPGTNFPVTFATVMEALSELDRRIEEKARRSARHRDRGLVVAIPRRDGAGGARNGVAALT